MSLMLVSTAKVSKTEVLNLDHHTIGQIQDLIMDMSSGRLIYLVMTFNPELDLGNREYPIPFPHFAYDKSRQAFLLKFDRDKLKYVKSYEKGNWPDISDVQWNFDTYLLYGYEPFWEEKGY